MAFNAVVSGGVVALPPRDATKELTDPPYELVRLLAETPLPVIPGIPGTVGLDITELNLRGVSLRNLRLDASTDTQSWTIDTLRGGPAGRCPRCGLTGNLSVVDGHPILRAASRSRARSSTGSRRCGASRRRTIRCSTRTARLTADVALSSDTLTLSAGTLVVAGINQGFDASIGFGHRASLTLNADFTTLGAERAMRSRRCCPT